MLKALETLGNTLNDTEWKSKINDLMNLLDSKDWEVKNVKHYSWHSDVYADNIRLIFSVYLTSSREECEEAMTSRSIKFSKAHSYELITRFEATQYGEKGSSSLLIEDVFLYKFGKSLSLNTPDEIIKAIKTLEEIETFFLSNPHEYSFDSVEDLFEYRTDDWFFCFDHLVLHKDRPPIKRLTREEGISLIEWEDGSVDPLRNVVLGWGENSDEAWRMAHARWWSLTPQDRDALVHGTYILGV